LPISSSVCSGGSLEECEYDASTQLNSRDSNSTEQEFSEQHFGNPPMYMKDTFSTVPPRVSEQEVVHVLEGAPPGLAEHQVIGHFEHRPLHPEQHLDHDGIGNDDNHHDVHTKGNFNNNEFVVQHFWNPPQYTDKDFKVRPGSALAPRAPAAQPPSLEAVRAPQADCEDRRGILKANLRAKLSGISDARLRREKLMEVRTVMSTKQTYVFKAYGLGPMDITSMLDQLSEEFL
jgi:hypothetical protein